MIKDKKQIHFEFSCNSAENLSENEVTKNNEYHEINVSAHFDIPDDKKTNKYRNKNYCKNKKFIFLIDVQEKYYKNLEKNNIYKNNQLKLFGENEKMIRNSIKNQNETGKNEELENTFRLPRIYKSPLKEKYITNSEVMFPKLYIKKFVKYDGFSKIFHNGISRDFRNNEIISNSNIEITIQQPLPQEKHNNFEFNIQDYNKSYNFCDNNNTNISEFYNSKKINENVNNSFSLINYNKNKYTLYNNSKNFGNDKQYLSEREGIVSNFRYKNNKVYNYLQNFNSISDINSEKETKHKKESVNISNININFHKNKNLKEKKPKEKSFEKDLQIRNSFYYSLKEKLKKNNQSNSIVSYSTRNSCEKINNNNVNDDISEINSNFFSKNKNQNKISPKKLNEIILNNLLDKEYCEAEKKKNRSKNFYTNKNMNNHEVQVLRNFNILDVNNLKVFNLKNKKKFIEKSPNLRKENLMNLFPKLSVNKIINKTLNEKKDFKIVDLFATIKKQNFENYNKIITQKY